MSVFSLCVCVHMLFSPEKISDGHFYASLISKSNMKHSRVRLRQTINHALALQDVCVTHLG